MVSYNKLKKMLIDRDMRLTPFITRLGFSTGIVTKISKNKYVTMPVIEKICYELDCGVDEILEFIPDQDE